MNEKRWIFFAVPGLGDIACWVNPEEISIGNSVEVENATKIMVRADGQVGFMKVSEKILLNMGLVAFWFEVQPDMKLNLSKAWDQSVIIPAKRSDLRILPHD